MNSLYSKLSITLLLASFLHFPLQAASTNADLMKAKYLYEHLAFNEAIPYYEKVVSTVNDLDVYAQLGDCYRLIKNPQKAVVYYAKAVSMSGAQPITKLHYAQTLLSLQKYQDALPWLLEYQKAYPEDRRVVNLINGAKEAPKTYAKIPEGSTRFMNFNTDGNEFGPFLREGSLLITADTVIKGRKKTDHWTGNPYYNIYSLVCDSIGNCGEEFKKMGTNLNTKFHDGPIVFSADGKEAYFTRTNFVHTLLVDNVRKGADNVVHLQIMVANGYDNVNNKFGTIKPFSFNSKNYSTAHPSISPSGKTLVFSSDMPNGAGGGTDLYICTRDEKGAWSTPTNLGKTINTEGEEMFPYLHDDETLYFSSDGWPNLGGLDIYKSTWNPRDNVFSIPEQLGTPINSAADDMSLILTADGSTGYFASNRVAPKGGDNIYQFMRQEVYASITVVDEYSEKPINGCNIVLESIPDKRNLTTGNSGSILSRLYPQTSYVAKINRLGYESQTIELSTISKRSKDTITKFVKLKPNTQISYNALILDRATMEPIENPWVVLTKINSDKKPDTLSIPTGEGFNSNLQTNAEYQVYAVKPNYYSDEKFISTKGIIPGSNDGIRDTIFMKKLEVGAIIRIENIYYDYDKANIREDAKPSLNRLLELMQQNKGLNIQINSHTDCRGSDTYNAKLSQARAASVVKYLNQSGIEIERMQSKGFGEFAPIDECSDCKQCSEEQHQKNRRTEFQILKM
ncbi:MAG: OmpA family protein [Bacteroidota bacterium]